MKASNKEYRNHLVLLDLLFKAKVFEQGLRVIRG